MVFCKILSQNNKLQLILCYCIDFYLWKIVLHAFLNYPSVWCTVFEINNSSLDFMLNETKQKITTKHHLLSFDRQ